MTCAPERIAPSRGTDTRHRYGYRSVKVARRRPTLTAGVLEQGNEFNRLQRRQRVRPSVIDAGGGASGRTICCPKRSVRISGLVDPNARQVGDGDGRGLESRLNVIHRS